MDRAKLALVGSIVAVVLVVGVHVALSGQAMVCGEGGCHRPGPPPGVDGALAMLVLGLAATGGFLAVRALHPSPFAFGCAIVMAVSAGVLVLSMGTGGGSSCVTGSGGAVCHESPAAWIRVMVVDGMLALAAGLVGALVGRLFSTAPRSLARVRGLRMAIAALALCFLVPGLMALRAPAVPDGVEWQLEGRQLCARWSHANGGGESCRALSGVIVAPMAIVAGGSAALHAGRPSWRWSGWLAVGLGAAAVATMMILNVASTARTQWFGTAALTAGLALACWLLARERLQPTT